MNELKVSVLLTTHNGQEYLSEQIESLLNQTYKNFLIYVSDDNSKDNTLEIIKNYINKFPEKIILVSKNKSFGSAKANFLTLLDRVNSDVFLFCDQDDVWTDNHVEELVEYYKKLSNEEKSKPVVIHSDLYVVDAELNMISESFFDYSKKEKNPKGKFYYFLDNNVTGCVMLFNDKLKSLVLNDNINTLSQLQLLPLHDQFLAGAASLFGNIYFIDKKLEYYRQHKANEVGAKGKSGLIFYINKLFKPDFSWKNMSINLVNFYLNSFSDILDIETKCEMTEYIACFKYSKLHQIQIIKKTGFRKEGNKKYILQILSLLKR